MLRATMIVAHDSLLMDDANQARLREALLRVFGQNRQDEVLSASPLFAKNSALWQDRVCFGCVEPRFSMLCWRDRSTEIQLHIEPTSEASAQNACETVRDGIWQALRSHLRLRPRLLRLEVIPYGDTRPILIGKVGLATQLGQRATLEPASVAIATAAIVGVGGFGFWPDHVAALWAGAAPVCGLGLYTIAMALISGVSKKIKWVATT